MEPRDAEEPQQSKPKPQGNKWVKWVLVLVK